MNKQKFQDLLNQTRKSKDKISQGVYEDLLSRIGNKEITLKVNELSSSEIISILKKMSDERQEAYDIYIKNNKSEAAQKEQDEKIDKAIADNDVDFVNTFVHDKLQDKGSRNSSGQSDNIRRD